MEWLEVPSPPRGHGDPDPGWSRASQQAVQFVLKGSGDVLFGALGILADLTLTLFVLFFFFRDGDTMAARAIRLIPLEDRRKERLDRHLQSVTRAVVFGTVVTALVQGTLLGLGFGSRACLRRSSSGCSRRWRRSSRSSEPPSCGSRRRSTSSPRAWSGSAIFLVAWSAVVVGSADNFLRPLLVSGKSQIGTLTVFFGVLGGLAAFGFIGLFLGPVILALVLSLIEFAEEDEAPPADEGPGAVG